MSNSIILAFGSDENYFKNKNLKNYIESIEKNSSFDRNVLVFLGESLPALKANSIEVFSLKRDLVSVKNTNNCVQHGEFLNAEGFNDIKDSDVIIFTDGDMTLQRGLTQEEEVFLRELKDNEVYVGYNASPTENLVQEVYYFNDKNLAPNWQENFEEDLQEIKCYNTGVLCMNKKTWSKLKNLYIKTFHLVDKLFNHYAKQQWLISYIIGTMGFEIYEMDYNFHNHSIYHLPNGSKKVGDVLFYNDQVVLFKHKWY